MKVSVLKNILDDFDDNAEVFVTLYGFQGSTEVYEVTSVTNNSGHLEIVIDESEIQPDIDFMDHDD